MNLFVKFHISIFWEIFFQNFSFDFWVNFLKLFSDILKFWFGPRYKHYIKALLGKLST